MTKLNERQETTARKAYREPQLVEYGLLTDVTQGGKGSFQETSGKGKGGVGKLDRYPA